MSNIYHTEPPTNGKVLIRTSFGDVDMELWSKEAPLACRNFIQLALEGYYDHSIVNRVIKDFMIQMGDPTGTGKGGESVWGRPFKDEVHGRIKFNHRGQVAMANENKPNTNRSQFFITLGPCDWLDKKHTIFGKITGNTFYNVARLADADVDANDMPVESFTINSIEILSNPFEDIVPRDIAKPQESGGAKKSAKRQREGKKDLKLLSFGDEEEEEPVFPQREQKKLRMISAHEDKSKPSSRLVPEVAEELQNIARAESVRPQSGDVDEASKFSQRMKDKLKEKHRSVKSERAINAAVQNDKIESHDYGDRKVEEEPSAVMKRKEEFEKLREETMRSRQAVKVLTGVDAQKAGEDLGNRQLITPLEQKRQRYIKRKKEFGNREAETLARLSAFTSKVKQTKSIEGSNDTASASMYSEVYSGQVLDNDDEKGKSAEKGDDKEDVDESWFTGKLKFRKHVDDAYRSGSDGRQVNDYEVIDPRMKGYGGSDSRR